jgi:hypothetical protein
MPDGFRVPAGKVLTFDPNVSTTVRVGANVVVEGTLRMKPASPQVVHRLVFEGIDEARFVGGGMDVLESDIGLWVIGSGVLDIAGSPKVAWNRTGIDPTWLPTDELRVTPTDRGDFGSGGFPLLIPGDPVPRVENPFGYAGSAADLTFVDTAGSPHVDDIEAIAAAGVTKGCGGGKFCPDEFVTRGQMAVFLGRALGLGAAASAGFVDTVGHPFEAQIDALAAAGVTKGCGGGKFCPDEFVTREQMATFLARAFGLLPPAPVETDFRAEVLNLTRNVSIEGTAAGRAHILIRSSRPHAEMAAGGR